MRGYCGLKLVDTAAAARSSEHGHGLSAQSEAVKNIAGGHTHSLDVNAGDVAAAHGIGQRAKDGD